MPLTEKVLLSAFLGTLQINSQVFTCRNLTFLVISKIWQYLKTKMAVPMMRAAIAMFIGGLIC